jgi:energy-converting hydrogenase Eha subunit B
MHKILNRLAAEPAAIGSLLASVLPALVALGLISLDAEAIGVLVVAVNTIVGFAVRTLVFPAQPQKALAATADA